MPFIIHHDKYIYLQSRAIQDFKDMHVYDVIEEEKLNTIIQVAPRPTELNPLNYPLIFP